MFDTVITVVGNLTEDPRYAVGESGVARASFRIASTPRKRDKDSGQWVDQPSLFLSVTAWRQLADHCAESLRKGDKVIVQGRLRQREYEASGGTTRSEFSIDADAVGPDLFRYAVTVNRVRRDEGDAVPFAA